MAKPYRIVVFGKPGCDKCKALKGRIDRLLQRPDWEDFERSYCDLSTEDGLIAFCESECVNPSRIPAFLIMKRMDADGGEYRMLRNPDPHAQGDTCQSSRLFTYLGLQTDYKSGGGVITPKMITHVLEEARTV